MSVHGMKPTFTNKQGYQEWLSDWRELYARVSAENRSAKLKIKHVQRFIASEEASEEVVIGLAKAQRESKYRKVMARKLLTVLEEARIRYKNIRDMEQSVRDQMKEFPLSLEATRNIDFHFNKKSLEFDFVPMWVVKARGKSYYCHSVVSSIGFSTRETPDHPSTKGSIRFKKGTLRIDEDGVAYLS